MQGIWSKDAGGRGFPEPHMPCPYFSSTLLGQSYLPNFAQRGFKKATASLGPSVTVQQEPLITHGRCPGRWRKGLRARVEEPLAKPPLRSGQQGFGAVVAAAPSARVRSGAL